MVFEDIKVAIVQGLIVLIPAYTVAYYTDKMVWTIPMLAASSFFAASIKKQPLNRKIDEEGHKEGVTHDPTEDG